MCPGWAAVVCQGTHIGADANLSGPGDGAGEAASLNQVEAAQGKAITAVRRLPAASQVASHDGVSQAGPQTTIDTAYTAHARIADNAAVRQSQVARVIDSTCTDAAKTDV